MRAVATVVLVLAAMVVSGMAGAAERRTLVVGAGEVTGYYYPVAGALCRVLNKERPNGMTCAVSPSSGSAANVEALRAGDIDLAVLQSRAAELAVSGGEGFKDAGPFPDLRALMSLHGESVVVVAREGSGIDDLSKLKGKRVNLGRPGSFQRAMANFALDAAGVSEGELAPVVELDMAEQTPELCEGNIDVAFFTGVHPMPEVATAIEDCNATLVPVKGKAIDGYLKKHPWLSRSEVRSGTYAGVKGDVSSLALKAILATTTRLPEADVHAVMKAIYGNFNALSRLHPVLKGLGKGDSARDGITIKLHPGAEKFFAETGMR